MTGDNCSRTTCTIFRFKKGQLFIGHPHLIHSGGSASEWNLHLHFYLGLGIEEEIHDTDVIPVVQVRDIDAVMESVLESKESIKNIRTATKRTRSEWCREMNK